MSTKAISMWQVALPATRKASINSADGTIHMRGRSATADRAATALGHTARRLSRFSWNSRRRLARDKARPLHFSVLFMWCSWTMRRR